jgi:ComF family protein
MKYHDSPYIARYIAEAMYNRAAGEPEAESADMVIPVPMYALKKRRRGYNQAELIAARLAELLGIAYTPNLLIKTKSTDALSTKNRDERFLSLANVFTVQSEHAGKPSLDANNSGLSPIENQNILLIDDVFTTGATADACAHALYEAGAASVTLFVFATGALN